ncbi:MAG: class I SAM-dependent methyltransferase [Bacteroidales bacterium]|nr:class I SAM-dependent methyltransferase [Bacteroidales bacterium]
MQYDPIKRSLGKAFNRTPWLRKLFYRLLDLLLLRSWHIKRQLLNWAAQHAGDRQVLDAGSGFGQYSYFMARKFPQWKITSLDVKEEQIIDCNQFFRQIGLHQVRFEVADLTELSFDNQFDMILCVDVMEHIEDDRKVLQNYFRALKPGAMLLISTPSDQGGSDVHGQHESDENAAIGFIDEHVRDGYAIDDLKEKLLSAGFKSVELKYQYGKPGKLSWKLSMKLPIILLNISKWFFILLPFYYLIVFPFCLLLNLADLKLAHRSGTGIIAKAYK